jgi:uncharacterized protein
MEKSFNQYQVKSQSTNIKDIDEAGNKVAMYLSAFDVIDSDNDMIMRGAFSKSIQERGPKATSNRKIAFLRYHDWEKPIGKFIELSEDEIGLFAVAEMGSSTIGKDALADYKDGIIREHSIGFNYLKDKVKFVEDASTEMGGYYMISEVKLWEGSAVTFGANEFTPVEFIKSATKEDLNEAIKTKLNELNIIAKALASGEGTDERLYALEQKHNLFSSQINSLLNTEPSVKVHLEVKEPKQKFDWQKVVTNINF